MRLRCEPAIRVVKVSNQNGIGPSLKLSSQSPRTLITIVRTGTNATELDFNPCHSNPQSFLPPKAHLQNHTTCK